MIYLHQRSREEADKKGPLNGGDLAKKVTCIAMSAALACGMVPAASLTLMSTPDEALAATKTEGCRTNRVIEAYLTQNADGTYSLDRSKLTTREQWKDLGIAGFFLYAGYDKAADLLLNPWNYTYLNNQEADINRHLQMDNLGAATDASAYDNMAVTYQLVNDLNLCRQEENRSEGTALEDVKISPELVAWEVRAVNFSSTIAFQHCESNLGSDIIAYDNGKYTPSAISENYKNPFAGWYFKEKEAKLNGQVSSYGGGHYDQIVMDKWVIAGGAKANTNANGGNNHTYGVNMANDKRVASQGWTVMEIADYQKALDAYMSFVESQPSVAGSGLDGNTSTGDSGTTTKPQTPKPTFKYPDTYTWGTDPDTTSAQTYPTFTATGAAVTVSPIITLDGKVLTEGVDYTLSYVSNVNPGKATWTAKSTSTTASWVLTDDFIITKAVEATKDYEFYSLADYRYDPTTYKMDFNNYKSNYSMLKIAGTTASDGWHTLGGHDYYTVSGCLVTLDTTIDGVKYQAVYDEPTQTYYLEKVTETTSPDPVTPTDPSEKPTEPSTPSGGDNTGTDKPVTPTEPEKPSGGSDKPSTGGDTPTNPGTTNPGGNTGNTEKPTTPVNPGGSTPTNPGTSTPVAPTEPAKPSGAAAQAAAKADAKAKATAQKAVKKAKVTAKKAKAAIYSMTVSWKKLSAANQRNASGFEVQYSTSKKFKSAKTKLVSGSKKTSAKVSGLKAGTKYYARVRAYKNVKLSTGKTARVYGAWSKAVSAKTVSKPKAPKITAKDVRHGFRVSWGKVSGASGYQICWCSGRLDLGLRYPPYRYKKVGKNTTSKRLLGDSDGDVIWVRAYKKVGKEVVYSAWSKPKQAFPLS